MTRDKADGGGATRDATTSRRSILPKKKEGSPKGGSADCGVCKKVCKANDAALECDECNGWYHADCEKVPKVVYEFYNKKNMASLHFYWKCSECASKARKGENVDLKEYVDATNSTLSSMKEEMACLKKMMEENGKMMKENGKVFKEEMTKAKPTFAEIVGSATKESKKVIDNFATHVANTQKRISEDREARKNNIIIFNLDEEDQETKEKLEAKFEKLSREVDENKKYQVSVDRIKVKVPETQKNEKEKYPRPVKVTFSDNFDKRIFLSKLRNLKEKEKYKNVRIQHDMNIEDRIENRRLLKEAFELNQKDTNSAYRYIVRGPPWAQRMLKVKKN